MKMRSQAEGDTRFDPEYIPLKILFSLEVENRHGDTSQLIECFPHQHASYLLDWWGHIQVVIKILIRYCLYIGEYTSWKMLTSAYRVSRGAKRHSKTQLSCSLTLMRVSLKTGFFARSKYSCLRRFINLGSSPCLFRICFIFYM